MNYKFKEFYDEKITTIIEEISEYANVNFSYNSDIIPDIRRSIVSSDLTIKQLLDSTLNKDSIEYKFEEFENHHQSI